MALRHTDMNGGDKAANGREMMRMDTAVSGGKKLADATKRIEMAWRRGDTKSHEQRWRGAELVDMSCLGTELHRCDALGSGKAR